MKLIEINSRWKHNTCDDVYIVVEQYLHRVVLRHELSGKIVKVTVGHLNPEGFNEYSPL